MGIENVEKMLCWFEKSIKQANPNQNHLLRLDRHLNPISMKGKTIKSRYLGHGWQKMVKEDN